ncbi:MAG: hypothetical protein LQ343_000614 [Gyalolechia ehrenbergii]|nr:MAG: hypothetical protein LQ343_000614 [Gyalolechia ehrenbergii]
MYNPLFLTATLLATSVVAKQCTNITVPVSISARNGVFNIPTLRGNADATTFAQNLTSIRGNFTEEALLGYATVTGVYDISAKFCKPETENGTNPTVQLLTHGLGFDKTYWDLPYNNFNYSYIDVAVDQYGFCTLSIDRLGEGNSSKADPLDVLQVPAEMSALYELTIMLRNGTLPSVPQAFNKVVHVGHSFGSTLSVALAIMHPTASDGLILTGYSQNGSYLPTTVASWDSKLARLNQPLRFGNISYSAVSEALSTLMPSASNLTELANALSRFNITVGEVQEILQTTDIGDLFAGIEPSKLPKAADLPPGYLTWTDAGSNQFAFLLPEFFDPSILLSAEYSKFPYTLGELLTIGSGPYVAPNFRGPVQIVTGRQDAVYCGGDCLATGDPALASIPAKSKMAFPAASAFEAYIQPNTAHGINLHYNSTGAYNVIQRFLKAQGLASS